MAEIIYTHVHSLQEVADHPLSKMGETRLIIIHDPGMRPGWNRTGVLWICGPVLYHWANSPLCVLGQTGVPKVSNFEMS